jgi:hypothetical protein
MAPRMVSMSDLEYGEVTVASNGVNEQAIGHAPSWRG